MNEIGFGALGGILPEIILLIGGLLILLLDMAQTDEQDSGKGFMAVTVVFLIVALVGVILQLGMQASCVRIAAALKQDSSTLSMVRWHRRQCSMA